MSLTYSIDTSARIVTIQYSKNPTFEEFERTMEAVFNDSSFKAGFNFLIDRRLIDEPPSTEYVRRSVDLFRKHEIKLNRLAIVVSNMATYGMVRMAQTLADGVDVQLDVFTGIEQAKQWLQSIESN